MVRLAAALLLVLAAAAEAQTKPRAMVLSALSDCLRDAIVNGTVEADGDAITFACTAVTAKTLYESLGRNIASVVVRDRNGKFENRAFGNSACYHRIEDESGKTADEFRCDVILAIGDALRE